MDLIQARISIQQAEQARMQVQRFRETVAGVRRDTERTSGVQRTHARAVTRGYAEMASAAETSARRQKTALASLTRSIGDMRRQMGAGIGGGGIGSIIGAASAGYGLVAGSRAAFSAYAQQFQFRSTLKLMAGDQASVLEKAVNALAERLGAPLQGMRAGVMGMMGVPGMTPQRTMDAMEAFTRIGQAAGATADDIEGALLQLRQTLGSGFVQGDELRIIAERIPIINKVLADFGTSIGAIKTGNTKGKQLDAQTFLQMFIDYARRPDVMQASNRMANSPMAESTRLMNDLNLELAQLAEKVIPQVTAGLRFIRTHLTETAFGLGALIAMPKLALMALSVSAWRAAGALGAVSGAAGGRGIGDLGGSGGSGGGRGYNGPLPNIPRGAPKTPTPKTGIPGRGVVLDPNTGYPKWVTPTAEAAAGSTAARIGLGGIIARGGLTAAGIAAASAGIIQGIDMGTGTPMEDTFFGRLSGSNPAARGRVDNRLHGAVLSRELREMARRMFKSMYGFDRRGIGGGSADVNAEFWRHVLAMMQGRTLSSESPRAAALDRRAAEHNSRALRNSR